MANPMPAFKGSVCDSCVSQIDEGDDVYFSNVGKLCSECANDGGYACECGNFKKPGFDFCYDCNKLI